MDLPQRRPDEPAAGAVRIRCNRDDDEADFTKTLRKQLSKGTAPGSLRHDPRLPGRRVSTSSLRAWMPQQPARHQPRFPAKKPAGVPPLGGAVPCQGVRVSSSLSKVRVSVEW